MKRVMTGVRFISLISVISETTLLMDSIEVKSRRGDGRSGFYAVGGRTGGTA
jgi:hypothetical protein